MQGLIFAGGWGAVWYLLCAVWTGLRSHPPMGGSARPVNRNMNNKAIRFARPCASAVVGIVFLWLGASLAASAQTPSPAAVGQGAAAAGQDAAAIGQDAAAADQGKVSISIDNQSPKVYGSAEIAGLPHTDIVVKGDGGRTRKYSGVALYDLLDSAGMELGGDRRPAALTTYLWVEASDGYRVLFSGAEVHRFIGAGEILLADSENGQPLSKSDGPYRLVVATDKVHARWLRQVRALHVIQAAPPLNSSK